MIQGWLLHFLPVHWKVIPPCHPVLWQQASLPTSSLNRNSTPLPQTEIPLHPLVRQTLSQLPAPCPHTQPCLPDRAWGSCPTWPYVPVGFAWQGRRLALGMLMPWAAMLLQSASAPPEGVADSLGSVSSCRATPATSTGQWGWGGIGGAWCSGCSWQTALHQHRAVNE